ncbi:MAG: 50S ribosomal protein L9 [Bacilli bacterium]|nr:50S ribosomal protein L9 [Bacilli bacterium]MDY6363065.1 50S ribosomal protein L9 [Bacilli bacterium]
MKVILLKDVKGVGKKQEIVNVKDGYGANYLIPHGLAVMYSEKSLEILENQKADQAAEIAKNIANAKQVAAKLKDITLEFTANSGTGGRMFGTISSKQIAAELLSKYGIEIDKRKFVNKTTVDAFGYTKLQIELYKGVIGEINVHVTESK